MVFAKTLIITVACEILLFHFGNQPQNPSKSNRVQYSLRNGEGRSKIDQFLDLSNSSVGNEQFAKQADLIIDRRNNKVAHFGSLEELDANVQEVNDLFERHPNLKNKFKCEWFVIHNYKHLKEAFPISV